MKDEEDADRGEASAPEPSRWFLTESVESVFGLGGAAFYEDYPITAGWMEHQECWQLWEVEQAGVPDFLCDMMEVILAEIN